MKGPWLGKPEPWDHLTGGTHTPTPAADPLLRQKTYLYSYTTRHTSKGHHRCPVVSCYRVDRHHLTTPQASWLSGQGHLPELLNLLSQFDNLEALPWKGTWDASRSDNGMVVTKKLDEFWRPLLAAITMGKSSLYAIELGLPNVIKSSK